MRGTNEEQDGVFSYRSAGDRVPEDHPLRRVKQITVELLKGMSRDFSQMYSRVGRPSIPPEKLLRALLLQYLYSIRSERLLMEELDYNLLFRWFVGLSIDDEVWDHSTFSKNRERLLEHEIVGKFFDRVCTYAEQAGLLSDEHFTVDGTLIEAWASQKSFRPKDGDSGGGGTEGSGRDEDVDYRGEKRSNATHESKSDPEARLYKKSKGAEARLCYMGHVLMENRNGLAVDAMVSIASGTAEQEAALMLVAELPGSHRITVGTDKAYDQAGCVQGLRQLNATPHVAQKKKGSALDARTVRHVNYRISMQVRKRVEEIFGWAKTVGIQRKTRFRGTPRVGHSFLLSLAAYDLRRIGNLMAQAAAT